MTKDFADDALRKALGKRLPAWGLALLCVLATSVFYVFARFARYALIDEFSGYRMEELTRLTAVVYAALYAVLLGVQLRIGRKLTLGTHVLLCVLTGVILLGKISLLDYVSDDYDIFLSNWIYSYTSMGLKDGLGRYIASDYSPPYLYILWLISRVGTYPWQYLVKAVSMLAEVLLGYAVMKLASLKVKGTNAQLLIFNITLILPTVVFNGAYWAQCDVIYTSFCLLALYLGLTGRGARSMICFGVALSFKLQTVFFLPMLLPMWLRKDIKLRQVLLIPAAYMGMMAPALWAGKSMHHVLTVYMAQAGGYNGMSINAPSLYSLLPDGMREQLFAMFGNMALMLGFAMLCVLCIVICANKKKLTQENALLFGLLVLSGVPFFLPKMHERYTFGADVLAFAVAAYHPKRRIVLPLLFGFASYVCYTGGLPGAPIMDLRYATLFMALAIALTAAELVRGLRDEREQVLTEVKA